MHVHTVMVPLEVWQPKPISMASNRPGQSVSACRWSGSSAEWGCWKGGESIAFQEALAIVYAYG